MTTDRMPSARRAADDDAATSSSPAPAGRRRSLRVLVVMPGIDPVAGAERSFIALVPDLVATGVRLHLAVLTNRQGLVPELERLGVVIHDFSGASNFGRRVVALRRTIKAIGPDLVHASLFEASVPSQLAVVGSDTPILVTWASTNYGEAQFGETDAVHWKLRLAQVIDAVAGRVSRSKYQAVTGGVARVNSSTLRVDRSRVMVGERGRAGDQFVVDPVVTATTRNELGLSADDRIILAVGRQDAVKGYESLVDAFEELADRHLDLHLVIAGGRGGATPRLEGQVSTLRHAERVHLLGLRSDVPALLAIADVVVCSSYREGAAGALIEAMASGTPVVSIALTGLEDVLDDGVNAVVVERDGIAAGIERVLSSPELADRLAAGGRSTFTERFTLGRASQRLREIYDWVVDASS